MKVLIRIFLVQLYSLGELISSLDILVSFWFSIFLFAISIIISNEINLLLLTKALFEELLKYLLSVGNLAFYSLLGELSDNFHDYTLFISSKMQFFISKETELKFDSN